MKLLRFYYFTFLYFWSMGSWTKPLVIAVNVIILVVLQRYLMNKGRSELIFQEFKSHQPPGCMQSSRK